MVVGKDFGVLVFSSPGSVFFPSKTSLLIVRGVSHCCSFAAFFSPKISFLGPSTFK